MQQGLAGVDDKIDENLADFARAHLVSRHVAPGSHLEAAGTLFDHVPDKTQGMLQGIVELEQLGLAVAAFADKLIPDVIELL